MKRPLIVFAVVVAVIVVAACSGAPGDPSARTSPTEGAATSSPSAPSTSGAASAMAGRIVFKRLEPGADGTSIFTVNPDGSDVQELLPGPAEGARWSPDGSEISVFCCDDGRVAHFIDVATGEMRTLEPPDPTLQTYCGGAWSPDGERLACEVYGVDDPSLNGAYSIGVSDGDLARITSNPGGTDMTGDYSPDGERIVFMRWQDEVPVGLFVANVDGSGVQQLTPDDMVLDDSGHAGSWSPNGDVILFVARVAAGSHKAIWTVNADGGAPEQLPITPTCGGPTQPGEFGCYSPGWSPDGEHIVFARSDGSGESIYMVNADGSGLVQITDGEDDQPDWGTPPSAP